MSRKREILERVASGDLTPEQAAEILETAEFETPPVSEPLPKPGSSAKLDQSVTGSVVGIRLKSAFRSATIVADPTIRTASVDGAHNARVDGDVLVIDGDEDEDGSQSFRINSGRVGRRNRRTIHIGAENPRPSPLTLRVNPSMKIEAEISAGSLKIIGMRNAINAEVSAGALSVEDSTGPLDLSTAAGPVKVRGRIVSGAHRIRCEAGAVKVILEEGSSVAIDAQASLGRVSLPGLKTPSGFAIGLQRLESTVGSGDASLSIECSVGGVKVILASNEDDNR